MISITKSNIRLIFLDRTDRFLLSFADKNGDLFETRLAIKFGCLTMSIADCFSLFPFHSVSIITELIIFRHKEVFIGFGVMLAWITILKYLEYSNNLNLMTSTLSKSWSNLFMFLLGVMPFFLGFVFLGQTIFWKYNKF